MHDDATTSTPDRSELERGQTTAPGRASAAVTGRAIVVGASSGIGAALVRRLDAEGWRVAALARRAAELEQLAHSGSDRITTRVHDVRAFGEVPELFESLVHELGGLDWVIFAAGVMPEVERHEYDDEKDLAMLAVNFAGAVPWANQAARFFRSQRSGTIVAISSIAGERGRKGNPMYGATKAGLNHFFEALRNRLAESNVHVCTIKPGFIDTVMTQGKKTFWLISADECARQILAKARARKNESFVPSRWWWVGFVIRWIPSALFRHLNV